MARVFHPDFFEFGQSGRAWTLETMALTGDQIWVELPLPAYRVELVAPEVALATVRESASSTGPAPQPVLAACGCAP